MVAIINSGTSIRSTFYYNENKVKEGVAECLLAQNYPMDTTDLNENMRLNMLLKMVERNPNVKRKSMHISLNFAPEEQHSKEKLLQIANEYMERIGFGEQPFLVYQHTDAGHPHLHIVTTKIRHDGTSIDTNNIGRRQSETARKELEVKYNLVKAEDHRASLLRMRPIDPSKVEYGKQITKRAIANVLAAVFEKYKYTSLSEFNAVLNLYNVIAERGSETSRTYKNNGLVYRVLNADGQSVSAPIKASSFIMEPTLKNLGSRFLKNDVARHEHKTKARATIDRCIRTSSDGIEKLKVTLKKEGIDLIPRVNLQGMIYGLTFIDHRTKCVYNGSDLGKQYAASAILERCCHSAANTIIPKMEITKTAVTLEKSHQNITGGSSPNHIQVDPVNRTNDVQKSMIEQLMESEYSHNYLPFELRKTRKRKKRKNNRL